MKPMVGRDETAGQPSRGGVIADVVDRLEGRPKAPHMETRKVEEFFCTKHEYPEGQRLVKIAKVGVPLSPVKPGGDLEQQLKCGNHRSAEEGRGGI